MAAAAAPPVPHLTPEQLAIATKYVSPMEAMMMAAFLTPADIQHQLDHISDNRGGEIIASVCIVAFLATASVALRLFCRRQMKVAISWDDYLILAGLVRWVVMAEVGGSERLILRIGFCTGPVFLSRL